MTPLVEYTLLEPGFFPGLFANGEEQPDFNPDKKRKPPAKKKAPAKKKSAPAKKKAPARKKK